MRLLMFLWTSFFLVSCASNQYLVDTKGVDMQQYETDLEECKAYAQQLKTGKTAAKSAGFGALVGAAIGAALGDSDLAADMATGGAIQGGASGGLEGNRNKHEVVKSCLRQRGYRVLN